jgi:hypothetical protein
LIFGGGTNTRRESGGYARVPAEPATRIRGIAHRGRGRGEGFTQAGYGRSRWP